MAGDQQDDPTDEAGSATGGEPRRLVTVGVAALVVLVVVGGYVAWSRNRPIDLQGIVEADGRVCFGWEGRIWTTVGTVRPPGRPDFHFPATFVPTGPHDGVLTASGTSVPASTSPTSMDPRIAGGCAIP